MNYYKDLGVENDATAAEIKAAHRRKAKSTHPDNNGDRVEFEKVQKAYSTLKDPNKREYYDKHGKDQEQTPDVALEIIAQMFDSMLTQELPSDFDYLRGLKSAISNTIAEAMGRKVMFERHIKRFEKIQKKFHRKNRNAANFFTNTIQIKAEDMKIKIGRADEVIANAKRALKILDDYEYEKEYDIPDELLAEVLKDLKK